MKKIKWGVALLLICFLFCSCGNTNNNNPAAEGAAQPATETASPGEEQKTADSSAEASDTVSANGYTVKIVAVHKTADSNGEPIAAMVKMLSLFLLCLWPKLLLSRTALSSIRMKCF